MRWPFTGNAGIVSVHVIEESLPNVAFSDIYPRPLSEKAVDAKLIGIESFNALMGKCSRRLLNKWHCIFPISVRD